MELEGFKGYHLLLFCNPFFDSLLQWRNARFGEKEISRIATKNPDLG